MEPTNQDNQAFDKILVDLLNELPEELPKEALVSSFEEEANAIEHLWTMLNKPSKSTYEATIKAKRVAKSAKKLVFRMIPDYLPYEVTWSDWAYGNLAIPQGYREFKNNDGSPFFSKENIAKMEADRANLPEVPDAFWDAVSLEEEANRRNQP